MIILRNIAVLAAIAMLTGCSISPTRSVVEVGFIDHSLLREGDLEGNLKLNNAIRTRVGVEWRLFDLSDGAFDIGLGLHSIKDGEMPGAIVGVDTTYKFVMGTHMKTKPYIIFSASFDKFTERWDPSTVDYGFTNSLGLGFQHDLSESQGIYLDYRWLHNSNGSTFHNDSFRKTFGLDKDSGPNPGWEGGMFTLGYSVDF
jgi:hypothetical protein